MAGCNQGSIAPQGEEVRVLIFFSPSLILGDVVILGLLSFGFCRSILDQYFCLFEIYKRSVDVIKVYTLDLP